MFDIGFSELVLIALLALIVLGPKRLPEVARAAGKGLARLRRFMTDVKQDFDRELNTAELSELRKLKEELHDTRRQIEQSSNQLYNTIAKDTALDSVTESAKAATPAPHLSAAGDKNTETAPPTPAAPRKRAKRAPTRNGGTRKA